MKPDKPPFACKGETILFRGKPVFDYQTHWNEQETETIAGYMNLAYLMAERDIHEKADKLLDKFGV